MYFLALFQYGCPRVFFGKKGIHDFPLFSIGARNQIWIHFQGDADAHTRGSMELGTSFQRSILSATLKCPSLLKATVPGRNCPHTARLLQGSL